MLSNNLVVALTRTLWMPVKCLFDLGGLEIRFFVLTIRVFQYFLVCRTHEAFNAIPAELRCDHRTAFLAHLPQRFYIQACRLTKTFSNAIHSWFDPPAAT